MPALQARPASLAPLALLLAALGLTACGGDPVQAPEPGPQRPSARAVLGASGPEARTPPTVERPWRGEGQHLEVSVWEMHCQGCELEVEDALKAVAGVAEARADHESSVVRIELDADASRDAVIRGIREAVHAQGRQVIGEDQLPPARR